MYTHIHGHMHAYSHTYRHALNNTHTHMHEHIWSHTGTHSYTCWCTYTHSGTHTQTHTHEHTCPHIFLLFYVMSCSHMLLPHGHHGIALYGPHHNLGLKIGCRGQGLPPTKGNYTNAQTPPSPWSVFPRGPNLSQFYLIFLNQTIF